MAKKNNNVLIIIAIIIAVLYLNNNNMFSTVSMQSDQTLYLNKPILVKLTTDMPSPLIETYFNDMLISSNITTVNGTRAILFPTVTSTGLIKVVLTQGNETIIQVIDVKNPYIKINYDFPTLPLDKDTSMLLNITTLNPQGEELNVTSVEVNLVDPTAATTKIVFNKLDINHFNKLFKFDKPGEYIFHIRPIKAGYETQETTVIVQVLKAVGIPLIVWIWFILVIIFIALLVLKLVHRGLMK